MTRNIRLLVLLICVLNSALTLFILSVLWGLTYVKVTSSILFAVLIILLVMEFTFLVLPWVFFALRRYQTANRIALASFAIVLAAQLLYYIRQALF